VGQGTHASPRLVVDVWLAVPGSDGVRVLMLRRRTSDGGFWQGVSGRVEPEDATLRDAALREIQEELGIAEGVRLLDLGRWFEFTSPFSGQRFRKRSLGAVLPRGLEAKDVRLSPEHVEARLVTFDEARRLVRWAENLGELDALQAAVAAGP
jgi:8-oxo-dGTP pyrophosphatase MutT (NUDIX family)